MVEFLSSTKVQSVDRYDWLHILRPHIAACECSLTEPTRTNIREPTQARSQGVQYVAPVGRLPSPTSPASSIVVVEVVFIQSCGYKTKYHNI